jgi:hypothetical protein
MEATIIIIEKIKKLFSLASSSNVNEASIALAKAYQLLTQYNLSEKDINFENKKEEMIDTPIVEGKKIRQWKISLIIEIATMNYCQAYRNIAINAENKIEVMLINLVGTKTNVEATRVMVDYILNAIDKSSAKIKGNGNLSIESFKVGYATTIVERIKMIKATNNNSECKELVIVLDKDIQDYMNQMKLEKTVTEVNIDDIQSYCIGRKKGYDLNLNKQIIEKDTLKIEN